MMQQPPCMLGMYPEALGLHGQLAQVMQICFNKSKPVRINLQMEQSRRAIHIEHDQKEDAAWMQQSRRRGLILAFPTMLDLQYAHLPVPGKYSAGPVLGPLIIQPSNTRQSRLYHIEMASILNRDVSIRATKCELNELMGACKRHFRYKTKRQAHMEMTYSKLQCQVWFDNPDIDNTAWAERLHYGCMLLAVFEKLLKGVSVVGRAEGKDSAKEMFSNSTLFGHDDIPVLKSCSVTNLVNSMPSDKPQQNRRSPISTASKNLAGGRQPMDDSAANSRRVSSMSGQDDIPAMNDAMLDVSPAVSLYHMTVLESVTSQNLTHEPQQPLTDTNGVPTQVQVTAAHMMVLDGEPETGLTTDSLQPPTTLDTVPQPVTSDIPHPHNTAAASMAQGATPFASPRRVTEMDVSQETYEETHLDISTSSSPQRRGIKQHEGEYAQQTPPPVDMQDTFVSPDVADPLPPQHPDLSRPAGHAVLDVLPSAQHNQASQVLPDTHTSPQHHHQHEAIIHVISDDTLPSMEHHQGMPAGHDFTGTLPLAQQPGMQADTVASQGIAAVALIQHTQATQGSNNTQEAGVQASGNNSLIPPWLQSVAKTAAGAACALGICKLIYNNRQQSMTANMVRKARNPAMLTFSVIRMIRRIMSCYKKALDAIAQPGTLPRILLNSIEQGLQKYLWVCATQRIQQLLV